VSFSERDGPSATFGRDLLNYIGILFEYWHDYKAGKLDRATFHAWMAPVRAQVEALLVRAAASNIDRIGLVRRHPRAQGRAVDVRRPRRG
jgi:transposase